MRIIFICIFVQNVYSLSTSIFKCTLMCCFKVLSVSYISLNNMHLSSIFVALTPCDPLYLIHIHSPCVPTLPVLAIWVVYTNLLSYVYTHTVILTYTRLHTHTQILTNMHKYFHTVTHKHSPHVGTNDVMTMLLHAPL